MTVAAASASSTAPAPSEGRVIVLPPAARASTAVPTTVTDSGSQVRLSTSTSDEHVTPRVNAFCGYCISLDITGELHQGGRANCPLLSFEEGETCPDCRLTHDQCLRDRADCRSGTLGLLMGSMLSKQGLTKRPTWDVIATVLRRFDGVRPYIERLKPRLNLQFHTIKGVVVHRGSFDGQLARSATGERTTNAEIGKVDTLLVCFFTDEAPWRLVLRRAVSAEEFPTADVVMALPHWLLQLYGDDGSAHTRSVVKLASASVSPVPSARQDAPAPPEQVVSLAKEAREPAPGAHKEGPLRNQGALPQNLAGRTVGSGTNERREAPEHVVSEKRLAKQERVPVEHVDDKRMKRVSAPVAEGSDEQSDADSDDAEVVAGMARDGGGGGDSDADSSSSSESSESNSGSSGSSFRPKPAAKAAVQAARAVPPATRLQPRGAAGPASAAALPPPAQMPRAPAASASAAAPIQCEMHRVLADDAKARLAVLAHDPDAFVQIADPCTGRHCVLMQPQYVSLVREAVIGDRPESRKAATLTLPSPAADLLSAKRRPNILPPDRISFSETEVLIQGTSPTAVALVVLCGPAVECGSWSGQVHASKTLYLPKGMHKIKISVPHAVAVPHIEMAQMEQIRAAYNSRLDVLSEQLFYLSGVDFVVSFAFLRRIGRLVKTYVNVANGLPTSDVLRVWTHIHDTILSELRMFLAGGKEHWLAPEEWKRMCRDQFAQVRARVADRQVELAVAATPVTGAARSAKRAACQAYNRAAGCAKVNCTYEHVCNLKIGGTADPTRTCGGVHPAPKHPK